MPRITFVARRHPSRSVAQKASNESQTLAAHSELVVKLHLITWPRGPLNPQRSWRLGHTPPILCDDRAAPSALAMRTSSNRQLRLLSDIVARKQLGRCARIIEIDIRQLGAVIAKNFSIVFAERCFKLGSVSTNPRQHSRASNSKSVPTRHRRAAAADSSAGQWAECSLWVKSSHSATQRQCPPYPSKRTSAKHIRMSALRRKQTNCVANL